MPDDKRYQQGLDLAKKPPVAESADGVDFRRVNKRIIKNLFTKIVFSPQQ